MISIDINNGGILTLHQDGHDKPIDVTSSNAGTFCISPGDFCTLINWYRYQKENGNDSLNWDDCLPDQPSNNDECQIAIAWGIDDVMTMRGDLTEEQCAKVLESVKKNHDANIGINWEVIELAADTLYPEYV